MTKKDCGQQRDFDLGWKNWTLKYGECSKEELTRRMKAAITNTTFPAPNYPLPFVQFNPDDQELLDWLGLTRDEAVAYLKEQNKRVYLGTQENRHEQDQTEGGIADLMDGLEK